MMFSKLTFLSACLLLFAVSAHANLVAYYPFEGNANDMSGYGNAANGTLVGSPTYDAGPANFGQALKLSTTSNYVNCGNDSKFNITGPITVCAWIKVTAWNTAWNAVITKGDNTWRLHRDNQTDHLNWTCTGTTGGGVSGTTAVNDNLWHHIAGVYDGANLILYIDGKVEGTLASTGSIATNTSNMLIAENDTYKGRTYNGWIDEVKIYDEALSAAGVAVVMLGQRGLARSPQPDSGSEDVLIDIGKISWKPGEYAYTHNVFFGTNFDDVNKATINVPLGVTIKQNIAKDVNYYNPALEYGKTYYWRVDEVNSPSRPATYKGTIWDFTTEPYAIKLPKEDITAAARSISPRSSPIYTVNEAGLDPNTDEHFNTSSGLWLSLNITDANDLVWIRYDFGRLYKINEMLVWNYNGVNTQRFGFRDVRIEYSANGGLSWTDLTVTEFAQGTGSNGYACNTTVPFNDIIASSVRITALSTWESPNYTRAGLSEVRFNVIPTQARTPSPEDDANEVDIDKVLSWRPGREAAKHEVYISTDMLAVTNHTVPVQNVTTNSYAPLLDFGKTFYWSVTEVNDLRTPKRWDGYLWNFTVAEYAILDDFEYYSGDAGREIYMIWDDGIASNTNGSQIGYDDSPYVETSIVQHGAQSAPVSYDNSGELEPLAAYSETTRIFATPLNLTVGDADTLKLYYRGRSVAFGEMPLGSGFIAMSGEGTDIGGNSDQFRFAYKTLSGDGSIVARVDGIQNTNNNAEAGVMIRSTVDANSAQVMAILRPNGTASFQRRLTNGDTTTGTENAGVGAPCWVKVTRNGDTFTAERSKDGEKWVSFETDGNSPSKVTVKMGYSVCIGLAVDSHVANTLAGTTFSYVSTTGTVSTGPWTVLAIGDTDQAAGLNSIDALYIAIEDSSGGKAKVYAPGNAVGSPVWMEWLVPYSQFTNVDMSKVKKFTIGIGDEAKTAKGKGMIYIDNISYGNPVLE